MARKQRHLFIYKCEVLRAPLVISTLKEKQGLNICFVFLFACDDVIRVKLQIIAVTRL